MWRGLRAATREGRDAASAPRDAASCPRPRSELRRKVSKLLFFFLFFFARCRLYLRTCGQGDRDRGRDPDGRVRRGPREQGCPLENDRVLPFTAGSVKPFLPGTCKGDALGVRGDTSGGAHAVTVPFVPRRRDGGA